MTPENLERLEQLERPRTDAARVVIDTDTYNEIDDQFAIVYALLSPEEINVEALYAAPLVVAPGMGSGSAISAASAPGYRRIRLELDPEYFRLAARAIPALVALHLPREAPARGSDSDASVPLSPRPGLAPIGRVLWYVEHGPSEVDRGVCSGVDGEGRLRPSLILSGMTEQV